MAKEFIFSSILLLLMLQSSFALETERKVYKPNNNTYEIPYVKPRKSFNITFNSSKITEHPRRIFNSYNPSRWGYYTDRNTNRNRKKYKKIKCDKGYEPICINIKNSDEIQCSCEKERICPYRKKRICYKNRCKCVNIVYWKKNLFNHNN